MELDTIKCPACGANVHFKLGKSKAICEYCGSTVVSEDYNSRDDAVELADSINNLIESLEDRDICKSKLRSAKIRYNDTVKRYKDLQLNKMREVYKYPAYGALAAVFFFWLIFAGDSWWYLLLAIGAGALVYPLYKYSAAKYESNLKRMRGILQGYKNNIADYQNELDEIDENTDFSIVPERYLNADALRFIADALSNGEAYDLHQAMAQYNAECKRREEHESLKAQLAAQKRQLDQIQANKKSDKKSDDSDIEEMEDTLKAVAATGAALYTGYKIIKAITRL